MIGDLSTWTVTARASTGAHLKHHAVFLQNSLIRFLNVPAQVAALYFLWTHLPASAARGLTPHDLLLYNILTFLVRWLFSFRMVTEETERAIEEGTLVNNLVRPLPFSAFEFGRVLSRLLINLAALSVVLIPALLIFDALPSPGVIGSFAVLMLAGAVVQYQIYSLIGTLSFWIGRIFGIVYAFDLTLLLTAGTLLPLSIYPPAVAQVLLNLPFRFFAYTPVQALIHPGGNAWVVHELLGALGWIIGLGLLHAVLWQQGLKRFSGAGV